MTIFQKASKVRYILTIEAKSELDAISLTLDLVDGGGFTLASAEIPVRSLVENSEAGEFFAEGLMDAYMRPKDYERVKGWNIGWKVPR